ncbi:MAG: slgA [Candidatus Magasanikbacteria bacterium]|nr:slgA [Candidatus Magasanikbacteria bacterium]
MRHLILVIASFSTLLITAPTLAFTSAEGGGSANIITATTLANLDTFAVRCNVDGDIQAGRTGLVVTIQKDASVPTLKFATLPLPTITAFGSVVADTAQISDTSLTIPINLTCKRNDYIQISGLRVLLTSATGYGVGTARLLATTNGGTATGSSFNVNNPAPPSITVFGGGAGQSVSGTTSVLLDPATVTCGSDNSVNPSTLTVTIQKTEGPSLSFDPTSQPQIGISGTSLLAGTPIVNASQISVPIIAGCKANENLSLSNIKVKVTTPAEYGAGSSKLKFTAANGVTATGSNIPVSNFPPAQAASLSVTGGTTASALSGSTSVTLSPLVVKCLTDSSMNATGVLFTLEKISGPTVYFDTASLPQITKVGTSWTTGQAQYGATNITIPVSSGACKTNDSITLTGLKVKLASPTEYGTGTDYLKVTAATTASAASFSVNNPAPATPAAPVGPPPVMTGAQYSDTNNDGRVDKILVNFDRPIQYSFKSGEWLITNSFASWSVNGATISGSVLTLDVGAAGYLTGTVGASVVLTYYGSTLSDSAGAAKLVYGSSVAVTDNAPPTVLYTSPSSGVNYVSNAPSQYDPLRITFSEVVTGGSVSVTPSVGTLSLSYVGTQVQVSHPAPFATGVTYTITLSGFNSASNGQSGPLPSYSFTYSAEPPSGAISINGGDIYSNSANVVVSLYSGAATYMRLSNSSDFTGLGFEGYNTQKAWVLPGGDGPKTVCVQFESSIGAISAPYCDSIILQTSPNPPGAPSNPAVTISGGASTVNQPQVNLTLSVGGASQMIISNRADFLGANWETYQTSKSWILNSGNGSKTVYAQFRTAAGVVSNVVSDSVTLKVTPVSIPGISTGALIKGSGPTVYYYGFDGLRHPFPNVHVFFSWYPNFKSVKKVKDTQLSAVPLGQIVTMRPGTYLIKFQTDPKVYAVEPGGVLRWILDEDTAKNLYGSKWGSLVREFDETFLADYTYGADAVMNVHPDGTVIQSKANSAAYYLESGLRRYITSVSVFNANNLQWKFVVVSKLNYIDGPDVTGAESEIKYPQVRLADGTLQAM